MAQTNSEATSIFLLFMIQSPIQMNKLLKTPNTSKPPPKSPRRSQPDPVALSSKQNRISIKAAAHGQNHHLSAADQGTSNTHGYGSSFPYKVITKAILSISTTYFSKQTQCPRQ
jgi:hypothetical protein